MAKKVGKKVFLSAVALVAVVLALLVFFGGTVVKHSVNVVGPRVLGVPVVLEQARFNPWQGRLRLSGLTVGNPEGFQTENLLYIGHLEADIRLSSIFSDALVMDRVLIDSPRVTYEVGMRRTNLGALLEKLEKESPPPGTEPEEMEKQPGTPMIIKELTLTDGRAAVSATAMRGHVVPVQLRTITLKNLGGEDQSVRQIATEVFAVLIGAVGYAVADAGERLGSGLQSALEGAGALGGHAVEGTRAAAEKATEGVRAVGSGVRGLWGGESAEEGEPEDEDDRKADKE